MKIKESIVLVRMTQELKQDPFEIEMQKTTTDKVVCDFVNQDIIDRRSLIKYIHKYIKENQLRDPNKRSEFIPDEKLRKVLPERELYYLMSMQVYVQQYF